MVRNNPPKCRGYSTLWTTTFASAGQRTSHRNISTCGILASFLLIQSSEITLHVAFNQSKHGHCTQREILYYDRGLERTN